MTLQYSSSTPHESALQSSTFDGAEGLGRDLVPLAIDRCRIRLGNLAGEDST